MASCQEVNPNGAGAQLQWPLAALALDINGKHAPASNTAAVVTFDADADQRNILRQIFFGYDAAPTGGQLKVEDGAGTIIMQLPVGGLGVQSLTFDPPLAGTKNTLLKVTLAAGGSGVTGGLYVSAYREL